MQKVDYCLTDEEIGDFALDFESKLILSKNNLEDLGFPIQRYSSEITNTNNHGYRLMDICKSLDIHIVNGRCGADSHIGRQTCKNSSVIDYVIMSPELFPGIHSFDVLDFDPLLSDIHCPVAFTINVQSQVNVMLPNEVNSTTDAHSEQNSTFPTWKSESRLEFLNYIQESNLDQINIDLDSLNQSEYQC